ncbi:MAG: SPOR domain-containing protein [Pseudomonadota bacterium]
MIFLPMIFNGKEIDGVKFESKIPPKPESSKIEANHFVLNREELKQEVAIATSTISQKEPLSNHGMTPEQPTEPKTLVISKEKSDNTLHTESGTKTDKVTESNETKVLNEKPKFGWVLQVATFQEKANAQKLVEKLQNKAFKAYVSSQKKEQELYYIVFVGPHVKKSVVESWKPGIDKISGSNSIFINFNPIKH